MQAVGRSQPTLDAAFIVGPLLVANALSWALWGILTAQVIFLARRLWRQQADGLEHGVSEVRTNAECRFGFGRKNANLNKGEGAGAGYEDVNPWRRSFAQFAAPSISAYPSQQQHARQRSSKSMPSSFDPYSPTAGHASPLDPYPHSILPQRPLGEPCTPSVYLQLTFFAMYVLVLVRTVLGTAQFWRVAIDGWGSPFTSSHRRWTGIVLADCIGPIIFILSMAYFIYVLYFAPSTPENHAKRSSLRPLSLLKSKTKNVLPEPYSFPFPQSPISTPRVSLWRRLRPNITELVLLILTVTVVFICGLIDCARSFKVSPLGAPPPLDAVALIWLAGMVVLDLVLCVLLCRALGRRLRDSSWPVKIALVMGEGCGALLILVVFTLLVAITWRGGKPPSTLRMVGTALFPAAYSITVLLHASHSSPYTPIPSVISHTPPKTVNNKLEDIEMGPRGTSIKQVDLNGATMDGSTYSTTADSADGGAALRARAMEYGARREKEHEKEREHERERERERERARMVLERDTVGEGSTGNVAAVAVAKSRAMSVRSGVSGALSLELPTFRRGKSRYGLGYHLDEESGSDMGSDEAWDDEIELDSEDGGGTWDYGFANAEREKERTAAATMLNGTAVNIKGAGTWQNFNLATVPPGPGRRGSYPALGPSRPVSWRRSAHPLATSNTNAEGDLEADENDDTLSMLSGTSTNRRVRARSYQQQQHNPYFTKSRSIRRFLPRTPGPMPNCNPGHVSASASTDSVFLSGPGSPAGSVLVIGRGREPSFTEPSVYRAASVAATRASTGSMWSTFSYTYPRPLHLPDLDADLVGAESTGGLPPIPAAESSERGAPTEEHDLGDAMVMSGLTGVGVGKEDGAPHPYSAAAGAGTGTNTSGTSSSANSSRRRWDVHPLKRIADMGRLRR